jgi:hypothetical protein
VDKTQLHREQDAPWLELGADALRHAKINFDSLELLSTWDRRHSSNAVYGLDGRFFLKLYGPNVLRQFHVEWTLLQALAGREDIPSPDIVAVGEPSDASPYLVMTRVPGSTAEEVWDDVSRREQLAIAEELGEIVAATNALPQGGLASVERRFGGRCEFAGHWRARLVEQIETTDTIPAQSRAAFVEFLEGEARRRVDDATMVTHRELVHYHIYLDRRDGVWSVSGIIDWADAMLGPKSGMYRSSGSGPLPVTETQCAVFSQRDLARMARRTDWRDGVWERFSRRTKAPAFRRSSSSNTKGASPTWLGR